MARALALAESGLYVPAPNPRVGCVVVKDGQIIAEGVTQAAGCAHAEVMALQSLQQQGLSAEGTTVYVSLEPCSHHGKTPPCTDALVTAKPARLVIAHVDPYPAVSGRGIAALRRAGIEVTVGVLAEQALEINPGFVSRMVRGTPFVWTKIAASMDRYTALLDGQSQWITGSQARADGHHWRARSCLVLTGIGTVRADDPQLNVRHVQTDRQPKRAVIDPKLEIPDSAKLLQTEGLILFAANPAPSRVTELEKQKAVVINVPERDNPDRVDVNAVMQWLAEHDINEVHVEAGAGINGALWRAGCLDELILYLAPTFLGHGMPMLDIPGIDQLTEAQQLSFVSHLKVGEDIRVRARRTDRWQALVDHIVRSNAQHQ